MGRALDLLLEQPEEQEKFQFWRDHTDLKETRPLMYLDLENGWNELLPQEFTCQCEGEMAQEWEMWLHKKLIYAEKLSAIRQSMSWKAPCKPTRTWMLWSAVQMTLRWAQPV